MIDYSLGKIYKLTGNGYTYYGSTCEPTLARRLAGHIRTYKAYLNGKHNYITSFSCFENANSDYHIVLVENFPCNNKDELHAKERYYIENNECCNKCVVGRTHNESQKEYYKANKQAIKELANTKTQCECGGKYTLAHKSRHAKSKMHQKFINQNVEV